MPTLELEWTYQSAVHETDVVLLVEYTTTDDWMVREVGVMERTKPAKHSPSVMAPRWLPRSNLEAMIVRDGLRSSIDFAHRVRERIDEEHACEMEGV